MKTALSNIKKILTAKQFIYVGITFIITSIGAVILLLYFMVKNRKVQAKVENK